MFHLILCLAITCMSSIVAADTIENTLPREVVFSEQLIQKYLTAREAYPLLLVSKFHCEQVMAYRNKHIKQICRDAVPNEETESIKKLDIIPQTIVVDISGNFARGVTRDSSFLRTFKIDADKIKSDYIEQESMPISYGGLKAENRDMLYAASSGHKLGVVLFKGDLYRQPLFGLVIGTMVCAFSYLPSGLPYMVGDIPVCAIVRGFDIELSDYKAIFYQKVALKNVNFHTPNKVLAIESIIREPICVVSIPYLHNQYREYLPEQLHDYSTS